MRFFCVGVVLLGIILRLVVFAQNRNLFIDEANVARNVYERSFAGLAQPLSYEQYAPPVFLWVVKLCALLSGYGERALKLYPLLSGLLTLWLLYKILLMLDVRRALWYPLILLATGFIYLRYATELKQYSSDAMIALGLIVLAIRMDIRTVRPALFVTVWTLCGSLAIWSSMSSVFILAAAGIYYTATLWPGGGYRRAWLVAIPALVWVCQFGYYYFTILKPQADSAYLQNFHRNDFIYLIPHSAMEWQHNGRAFINVLGVAGGHWTLSLVFHILCLISALYAGIRLRDRRMILIAAPVLLLFITAGLRQYSLQPRVVLFVMPLLLAWVGIGLDKLLSWRYTRILLLPASVICMINFGQLHYLWQPLSVTDVTDCFSYMAQQREHGAKIYIEGSAAPAYIYYTEIHPERSQWNPIRGATCLPYMVNMDSVAAAMPDHAALLLSYQEPEVMAAEIEAIDHHMIQEGVYKGQSVSQVMLFRKR